MTKQQIQDRISALYFRMNVVEPNAPLRYKVKWNNEIRALKTQLEAK